MRGRGRATRNSPAFEAILDALRQLEPDETLLVQSGKPVAVFKTHEDAPRVLIANSNIVPAWASQENFEKWATELQLDLEQFKKDMLDPKLETEIKRQQAAMVALGARGTPGFFVNGTQVKGAQPFPKFKEAIELCEKALAIRMKVLGKDHPETADSVAAIASAKRAQACASGTLMPESSATQHYTH